jgi:hypothetical protein
MIRLMHSFPLCLALGLNACASLDVPDVNFMGDSDFSETIAELDRSYPGVDEIPAIPVDVRSAEQWDQTAREMLALEEMPDAPDPAPGLTDAEFQRQFDAAKAATQAYKVDDPS